MIELQLQDVGCAVGRRPILEHLTATLPGGSITSVIGQNGGGKTTLLKAIAGLVKHTGDVRIVEDGKTLTRRAVSYVPQLTTVTSRLTVFEMVLLGLVNDLSWRVTPERFEEVDKTLHQMEIAHLAQEPVRSLSGGQKQLVFMAQAFVAKPKVLLLDEPTSALDLRHQLVVMNAALRYATETGAVCLTVVHDLLTAARFSRQLLLLRDGRIQALDTPEKVLSAQRLEPVYHVDVSVEKSRSGFLHVVPLRPHPIDAHSHHAHPAQGEDHGHH